MEQIYLNKASEFGYNQLVCDIFDNWENVKDEILIPERKSGSGNGTIHVFLGAADAKLRNEFPAYYDSVEKGEDPFLQAIEVRHYFLISNIISMTGYVGQYYYRLGKNFTTPIQEVFDGLKDFHIAADMVSTRSLFKLSIGSSKPRPYFKQFENDGVFSKVIRKVLLPNSSYKISLLKNEEGQYAAFWLIGFDWQGEFEADSSTRHLIHDKTKDADKTADRCLQTIYYGAPGTGKSFEINRITKNKQVIRTTFHPDSDYSTFVGAYKPTSIEIPVRDVTGKVIVENGKQVTENRIVYEFVEQAFLQAYIKAWNAYAEATEGEKAEEQYLVIEEINRGNCAQIFGDLFQLLDRNGYGFSDYPITADKDMKKQLAKAFKGMTIADTERINQIYGKDIVSKVLGGEILLLPDNLFIWATMNTSDQSLFPIDLAFKRRWDWKYIPICEGKENGVSLGWKIKVNGKLFDWWQFVEKINAEINELTKSEDKKLGYFFCKAQDGIVTAETFVSKVIFYLWNDVFKDMAFGSDIFMDGESELTFNSFYAMSSNEKAVVKEDKVEVFLQNLGVKYDLETVNGDDNKQDLEEEATDETAKSQRGETIISIQLPGNPLILSSDSTQFDAFVKALRIIGIEKIKSISSTLKYKRLGYPVISTQKYDGIVNNDKGYSYYQEGDLYIVKGCKSYTYIRILEDIDKLLNIGLSVETK